MKFVMLIAVSGGCAAMSMTSGFIGQLTNTFYIFNANIFVLDCESSELWSWQWCNLGLFWISLGLHSNTFGSSNGIILERCRKNQKDVVFLSSIYMYVFNFIQIYQIYSDFISVLFDSNWFQLISYDFIWQLLNFGWQLLGDDWTYCWEMLRLFWAEGKKSKKSNWKNHEKSKKSNFSKLLLWEKLGDIRNTMSSRKPGLVTQQLVSMSAFSAVRILPQMSAHDILRKNERTIVEKCILVRVWFSKCGTVILWSECALLFPLTQDPSFSNRKAGVPTYPGKLVPGSINHPVSSS